ncbi:hypothetical protein GCM10023075_11090 [Streptosporangium album]
MRQLGGGTAGIQVLDVVVAGVDPPLDEVRDPFEAVAVVRGGLRLSRGRQGCRREAGGKGHREHVPEESPHGLLHLLGVVTYRKLSFKFSRIVDLGDLRVNGLPEIRRPGRRRAVSGPVSRASRPERQTWCRAIHTSRR